jgi:ribosomal protein L16 Arg81 hydroxylase
MENGLPTKLNDGDILEIPKLAWHRVIKGECQLVVSIIE